MFDEVQLESIKHTGPSSWFRGSKYSKARATHTSTCSLVHQLATLPPSASPKRPHSTTTSTTSISSHSPTMRLSALLAAAALPLISLAANLQVSVPPTPQLPNPSTLPPSTTARLTTLSNHYSARLSAANDFQFRDVAPGSYLLEISCATHSFVPLRVDVSAGSNEAGGEKEKVQVWRTWRGNGWDSRGEEIAVVDGGRFEAWAAGGKDYYMVRQGCKLFCSSLGSIGGLEGGETVG